MKEQSRQLATLKGWLELLEDRVKILERASGETRQENEGLHTHIGKQGLVRLLRRARS